MIAAGRRSVNAAGVPVVQNSGLLRWQRLADASLSVMHRSGVRPSVRPSAFPIFIPILMTRAAPSQRDLPGERGGGSTLHGQHTLPAEY